MSQKKNLPAASYYYVLWGVIVALYSVAKYFVIEHGMKSLNSASILFLVGGVLSFLQARKNDEPASGIDKVYMKVWIGIAIGLFLVNTIGYKLGVGYIIAITLSLYCIGSLITGWLSKFTPSILGGVICAICIALCFYVTYAQQFLILAIAVIAVHVYPGIVMSKSNK
ncbi:MAG: hypothetical protein R2800_03680 [Flavipsychrobacter sp.]